MSMKIVVAVAVLAMSVGATPHASAGEYTVLVYETQPYWGARSHVLHGVGRVEEASSAQVAAVGLTEDPAVRAFLMRCFA